MAEVLQSKPKEKYWQILRIIIYAILFFFALDLMSAGFKFIARDKALSFINAADNPFIGLFIGLLATAIVQSSSTTTSIVVTLVASGAIQFETAVPLVMGANIGTTITAMLVSLAFIGQKKKFRRALSLALSHHFFNVILVVILFPLEYYYGLVSGSATHMTKVFAGGLIDASSTTVPDNFSLTSWLVEHTNAFASLLVSLILLALSIKSLARHMYDLIVSTRHSDHSRFLINPYHSFLLGLLLTAGVQSSSTTTSFAVPLAATGKIRIKRIFPFIIGANVGTTITAFIATFFKSELALSIAFTHLIFNLVGVLIFLPLRKVRKIPVKAATKFSTLTMKNRILGFVYFLLIFFILPFALIYFNTGR